MPIDTATPTTRRALLVAAVGGTTALIAAALGRPVPARAADGDPVIAGAEVTAAKGTTVTATDIYETAIWGHAPLGDGMRASGSETGLVAEGGLIGVDGRSGFIGVYGHTGDDPLGPSNAVGGQFVSTRGHALRTTGRVQFDKVSGVAIIPKGTKKVTVSPGVDISSTSKILTTLQSTAGGTTVVHRISRDMTANTFAIYLTANATVKCYVAWFVIG